MNNVLRSPDHQEPRMMSAMVARREWFSENNLHFVFRDVVFIAGDFVNSGLFTFFTRFILLGSVEGHAKV